MIAQNIGTTRQVISRLKWASEFGKTHDRQTTWLI